MKLLAAFLALPLLLTGCSPAMKSEDFAATKPELKLEEYFAGESRAWGMVQGRGGEVIKRMTVTLNGTWDEQAQTLRLVEDFVYDDGTTEQRIWNLTKTSPHDWEGTAHGVVGKAKGRQFGNALNLIYTFDLPYKGSTVRVKFDDWLFLQEDGLLLNRARMSKWGFTLADITIAFKKDR
jgi:Protein of unknown function (DUF3833)